MMLEQLTLTVTKKEPHIVWIQGIMTLSLTAARKSDKLYRIVKQHTVCKCLLKAPSILQNLGTYSLRCQISLIAKDLMQVTMF